VGGLIRSSCAARPRSTLTPRRSATTRRRPSGSSSWSTPSRGSHVPRQKAVRARPYYHPCRPSPSGLLPDARRTAPAAGAPDCCSCPGSSLPHTRDVLPITLTSGTRLERASMHWTVAGADAILALRCCRLSGRFEDFRERRSATASGRGRAKRSAHKSDVRPIGRAMQLRSGRRL
jgi:hypothetical protein